MRRTVKAIVLLLAAVLLASTAEARRWTGGNALSTEPGQAGKRTYDWTTDTTASDALTTSCGLTKWIYDDDILGSGTAAAATIRSCADINTPAAQCTDVAVTTDSTGTIPSSRPVIYVTSITSTGAATAKARVTVQCQEQFSSTMGTNEPADTDGDGLFDTVIVDGDYDGDGAVTPKDIHMAANDLTDTGRKFVEVRQGDYYMENGYADVDAWEADTEVNAGSGVHLPDQTTLSCQPGAKLRGWSAVDDYDGADGSQGFTMIRNAGAEIGSETENTNVIIDGCEVDLVAFSAPYTSAGQNINVLMGIQLGYCSSGCEVTNNIVKNTHHTPIYMRGTQNALVEGNVVDVFGYFDSTVATSDDTIAATLAAGDTVITMSGEAEDDYTVNSPILIELDDGSWHDASIISIDDGANTMTIHWTDALPSAATSGNDIRNVNPNTTLNPAAGIYFYNEDAVNIPNRQNVAQFNTLSRGSGIALHTRVDDACDGSGTNCPNGQNVLEDNTFRFNRVENMNGFCVDIRSSTRSVIEGNVCVRTAGFDGNAQGSVYCTEDSLPDEGVPADAGFQRDANCAIDPIVIGNQFLQNRISAGAGSGMTLGNFVEGARFINNTIDGSLNQSCFLNIGDFKDAVFIGNTWANCDENGWEDFNATDNVDGVTLLNHTLLNVGRELFGSSSTNGGNGMLFTAPHTNFNIDVFCKGMHFTCVNVNDVSFNGLTLRSVENGAYLGFKGRYTHEEAEDAFESCVAGEDPAACRNLSIIITDGSSTSDCDFTDETTGASVARCINDGTQWTAEVARTRRSVRMRAGTGDTIQNFSIDARVNDMEGGYGLQLDTSGTGSITEGDISIVAERTGIASDTATIRALFVDDVSDDLSEIRVRHVECGQGTDGDCSDANYATSDYWASESLMFDDETPSAACSTGARYIDTNGTSGATQYVCEAGAWVALGAGGGGDVTDVGDCATGACFTGASGTTLSSNTDIIIDLDEDNNGSESFQILDGADALVFEVQESGAADFAGAVTATSFTADPSATPTVAFDDSNDGDDGTRDAAIVVNCPTTDDCDMDFIVEAAASEVTAIKVDTTDAGVVTVDVNADLTGYVGTSTETGTTFSPTGTQVKGQNFYFSNTGVVTVTLPAATTGDSICIYDTDATAIITIDVDASDQIVLDGTALTAGNTIDSPGAAGDFVCLHAGSSVLWYVWGKSGTWVDGGAT